MAWGNSGNVSTTNLNEATDSPANARADLKAALDELTAVIDGLGTAGGAAKIESSGEISAAVTAVSTASGNLTVKSATSMVKIENFINLKPVAYASLPASPQQGDMAFLTTDGAGDTQNQMIYYNGSAWKYFNSTADGGTDATVDAS